MEGENRSCGENDNRYSKKKRKRVEDEENERERRLKLSRPNSDIQDQVKVTKVTPLINKIERKIEENVKTTLRKTEISEKDKKGKVERLVQVIEKRQKESEKVTDMTTPNRVQNLVSKFNVRTNPVTKVLPRNKLLKSFQCEGVGLKITTIENKGENPELRRAKNKN